MRGIIIQNQGMLATIQDMGRFGYRRYGMPVAGAMDLFSFRCANWLAGNPQQTPIIEATLTGPEIRFLCRTRFAVTGGAFEATINGKNIEGWRSYRAGKGSVLKVGAIKSGARIYIAFSGGFLVDSQMGSASSYLPGNLGGYRGRELRKGDILALGRGHSLLLKKREIKAEYIPTFTGAKTLRILPGVNSECFSDEEKNALLTSRYRLSPHCDRMGIRLEGAIIPETRHTPDIISFGIHYGAIQVPGDGSPIIMGADSQTTGGYRQFANVISADISLLGQLRPGDEVNFKLVDYNEAIEALKAHERILERILK